MGRTHNLPADSHTARRLDHATPEHLHQTTKRTFIGPIPEGWLKSHRKQWYRQYIHAGHKRRPSFRAAQAVEDEEPETANSAESTEPPRPSTQSADTHAASEQVDSTVSLLHNDRTASGAGSVGASTVQGAVPDTILETQEQAQANEPPDQERDALAARLQTPRVRFTEASRLQLRARAQRLATRGTFRSPKVKDGEMMRVDKMLVRIDITQQSLRDDYDEKISQGIETRSMDKWREFMVVCRKHVEEDAEAVLQLYRTRVISVSEGKKVKKRPKVQILLSNKRTKVNLYSALDKTLCVWTTVGSRTTIYYLRTQSGATAVEWYTFLNGVMGAQRMQNLQINVPDLGVSLRLDDPFRTSEAAKTLLEAAQGNDEALAKAVTEEKGAAGAIVGRCINMLKESPEWADILEAWARYDRIGLAWKRYDRIEWVHGAVEQRMYGTIAMQRTHDMELRPKHHYPATTTSPDGEVLEEPPPIEGFLIRLTSQQGHERKLGKMLFKRLYFTTQNQYLLFLRPAKASPPPPPKMPRTENEQIPSTKNLISQVPLCYDVDPYPLDGKHIAWLDTEGVKGAKDQEMHDKKAVTESDRNMKMMLACDGYISLCEIKRIRKFHRGATPADAEIEDGSDVDFHVEVDNSRQDDGTTNEMDEDRVFELLMENGLVIRLQAYNKAARKHWMKALRELSTYWSQRVKADMDLYRSTREQNLEELGIDERAEAFVGQFAYKWEVGKSYASPTLYHMCGIAACRTIHISGSLFRKPRKHSTFTRCHVILSHGHLLIFQDTLRKRSGKQLVHVHHERIASISLQGCYLYSGLLTENDLLYQNRTFDSNMPGHHALPRVYLEDGWTSTDEDAMTTFVIWHAKSKAWFKSSQTVDDVKIQEAHEGERGRTKTKLTRVSQLGATGRSVVFKARSRAERDHWVLAIQVEIERMAALSEDVRIVNDSDGS